MNASRKQGLAEVGLTLGFLGLIAAFVLNLWGRREPTEVNAPTPPEFTNTTTVRLSAADLYRTDGDTSGFACYSCHDLKKQLVVNLDSKGEVVLAEPHKEIVMQHGRKNRNDHCFNCHNPKNLEQLRVRDSETFKLTEGNRLCGACHGPTYRDWEKGVHGRVAGYWDRSRGAVVRSDCTSCHDPHSPEFPTIKPAPRPNPLHPRPHPGEVASKGGTPAH